MTDPLTARLSELWAKATQERPNISHFSSGYVYEEAQDRCTRDRENARDAIVAALPTLLSERAILIAERDEARALLEPFAGFPLPLQEPDDGVVFTNCGEFPVSGRLLYRHFRAARAYLTKTDSNHVTG